MAKQNYDEDLTGAKLQEALLTVGTRLDRVEAQISALTEVISSSPITDNVIVAEQVIELQKHVAEMRSRIGLR